jgi:drug/metabolite transporter (DMT)-like permease
LFISVIFFAQQKLTSDLFKMSGSDLGWLLFLGIACTSFAFLATIEVMKKLGAFTVSLSINLEPVYTILLAIPILHEDKMLSGNFYWGSLLILLLVIANGIYKRLREEKTSYAPKNKHQSLD